MDSITEALTVFRASADRFAGALADAPDTTWVFKPSPSVWSMAEVIEHVTMTDRGIRGLASQVLRPFAAGEHSAIDDAAIATIFDGSGPPPPDAQEPSGTWTDRAAAMGQFTDASDALAAWYERARGWRSALVDLRAPDLRSARRCAVAAVRGIASRQPHPRCAGATRASKRDDDLVAGTPIDQTALCSPVRRVALRRGGASSGDRRSTPPPRRRGPAYRM
jgi:hypothetical protein